MKMNKPLVSIVIPVYNVESYLEQCLNSVECQIYENFECVIIVDGATDHSYDIARRYCAGHPRFKVYYQDNAGSGPARNNGIARSSGDFVCFIDPDDWVEPNYIESMMEEQQKGNFDLVVSQSIDRRVDANDKIVGTTENNKPLISYSTQEECREKFPWIMFQLHYLDGPICKLFKTSLIKENRIEFPAYRRSQDMVFNFRYYNHMRSISTVPAHTYNIRYEYPPRPGRGRIFTGYHEIVAKIYSELSLQLQHWNIKSDYSQLLYSWAFWYLYASVIRNVLSDTNFDYIAEEPYKSIVINARPTLRLQRIIRFLLVNEMYRAVRLIIKITQKLK